MGRALYSTRYAVAEPEVAKPEANSPYAKWSRDSNYFDPDSDEFFVDAEYEAFVDPADPAATQAAAEPRSESPLSDVSSGSSSATSDNDHQEENLAPAEGALETPVTLMARLSRTDPDWANTLLRLGRAMDRHSVSADAAPVIPSPVTSAQAEQDTDVVDEEDTTDTPTGSSTPMPIPIARPLENDVGLSELNNGTPHSFQMSPPSPANVSPRLLSWGHARRTSASLTSSNARLSGAPIAPARIRVYGFAA